MTSPQPWSLRRLNAPLVSNRAAGGPRTTRATRISEKLQTITQQRKSKSQGYRLGRQASSSLGEGISNTALGGRSRLDPFLQVQIRTMVRGQRPATPEQSSPALSGPRLTSPQLGYCEVISLALNDARKSAHVVSEPIATLYQINLINLQSYQIRDRSPDGRRTDGLSGRFPSPIRPSRRLLQTEVPVVLFRITEYMREWNPHGFNHA